MLRFAYTLILYLLCHNVNYGYGLLVTVWCKS